LPGPLLILERSPKMTPRKQIVVDGVRQGVSVVDLQKATGYSYDYIRAIAKDIGQPFARKPYPPLPPRAISSRNLQIYDAYQNGEPQTTLAENYNLSSQRINQIVKKVAVVKGEVLRMPLSRGRSPLEKTIICEYGLLHDWSFDKIEEKSGADHRVILYVARSIGLSVPVRRSKRRPPLEVEEQIRQARRAGKTIREIVAEYGYSAMTVIRILKSAGLTGRGTAEMGRARHQIVVDAIGEGEEP
jgi:Mor family transcriptional regulator